MNIVNTIGIKTARARSSKEESPPKKILVMRYQALGDTIITLPYLQNLKRQYPEIELHFLTRQEVSQIPVHVALFDKVITIGGGRNVKLQFLASLIKIPWLLTQGYDAVLDLQNHRISRIIRKLLFVKYFSEFEIDQRTRLSAGERTRNAIEGLWRWNIEADTKFVLKKKLDIKRLLQGNGWKEGFDLIVLNPAGYSQARNWPLQSYCETAKLWLERVSPKTQFVLLLLPTLQQKASYIKQYLGDTCIDLTGKASQIEAFAILQKCRLIITEDGGLMHMAWIQRTPTLALFSSSRKDWSAPQGSWSICLDSADLECGPCNLEICKYADNRCLTRYTPELVVKHGMAISRSSNA
jgi:ADP-heptose:LPS heptosyltransferase